METFTDKRRKLTDSAKIQIHTRYFNRVRTGESVQDIARAFGVTRLWVREVAKELEKRRFEGPVSATEPTHTDNAAA